MTILQQGSYSTGGDDLWKPFTIKRLCGVYFLVLGLSAFSSAENTVTYTIPNLGGFSLATPSSPTLRAGYARVQPGGNTATPSGMAYIGYHNGNALVSETSVSAVEPIMSGRIYAEIGGTINTGVAIVNPSNAQASITVTFTDTNGTNVGPVIPPILLPANRQLTAFLNQEPFKGPSPLQGTFTFVSTVKIAVTALRINQNSQGEIILSTLPVVNLNAPQTGALYFPHFAAGGGWTSHVLLINPSDAMITGNIQFWTSEGQPGSVTIGGQTGSSFGYRIPAKSSQRFSATAPGAAITDGWVQMLPAQGNTAPSGSLIFSLQVGNSVVTEASVPASRLAVAHRLYAELSADRKRTTAVAIVSTSPVSSTVRLELTPLSGDPGDGIQPPRGKPIDWVGTIEIPANGHVVKLVPDVDGLQNLPRPFQGVLRVVAAAGMQVAVTGLIQQINERNDLLSTTTPTTVEADAPTSGEVIFPRFVDGGPYTMQFVLFNGLSLQQPYNSQQPYSGAMKFFNEAGDLVDLNIGTTADLIVHFENSPPDSRCNFLGNPSCTQLDYGVRITNNSESDATDVHFTYVLPVDPQLGVAAAIFLKFPASCAIQNTTSLNCSLGTLKGRASVLISVQISVSTAVTAQLVQNRAWVESDATDPLAANNSEGKNLSVNQQTTSTDLQLTVNQPAPVKVFTPLVYFIKITNAKPTSQYGPATAYSVNLTADFSGASSLFLYATPSKGMCAGSSRNVICNIGAMRGEEVTTIVLVVQPQATGTLTADFEVTPKDFNDNEDVRVVVSVTP